MENTNINKVFDFVMWLSNNPNAFTWFSLDVYQEKVWSLTRLDAHQTAEEIALEISTEVAKEGKTLSPIKKLAQSKLTHFFCNIRK